MNKTNLQIINLVSASFDFFVDGSYTKDKNRVYYEEKVIEGADPASFVILDEFRDSKGHYLAFYYAKDKNYVYYKGEILKGSNPIPFSNRLISIDFD